MALNYATDLIINKDALDVEWLNQPNMFFKYAREAAKADADAKRAKENLEVVDAEMYSNIRSRMEMNGDKITEAAVKAAVLQSAEHKKAFENLTSASEDAKITGLAVEAMNQRKYALENLVRLHLAGYYSSPVDEKGSGIGDAAIDKAAEKQNGALAKYKKKPAADSEG